MMYKLVNQRKFRKHGFRMVTRAKAKKQIDVKVAIARITDRGGKIFTIFCDEETLELTLDNGEELPYKDVADSAGMAFHLVEFIFGGAPKGVCKLEWLARYHGDEIIPLPFTE